MKTTLLLQGDDLYKYTPLGGNIDTDRYLNDIRNFQLRYLKKILTKPLYDKIIDDFENETLTGVYEELYFDYIREMVLHGSAMLYLEHGAYMISNSGITKSKGDDNETISIDELDRLVISEKKLFEDTKRDFERYMKQIYIPEYQKTENTMRINVGGWSLKKY